jgi:hypothetical protein
MYDLRLSVLLEFESNSMFAKEVERPSNVKVRVGNAKGKGKGGFYLKSFGGTSILQ